MWGSRKVWEGIKEVSGKDHQGFVSHSEGFAFTEWNEKPRGPVRPGAKLRQEQEKRVGRSIYVVYILLYESDKT